MKKNVNQHKPFFKILLIQFIQFYHQIQKYFNFTFKVLEKQIKKNPNILRNWLEHFRFDHQRENNILGVLLQLFDIKKQAIQDYTRTIELIPKHTDDGCYNRDQYQFNIILRSCIGKLSEKNEAIKDQKREFLKQIQNFLILIEELYWIIWKDQKKLLKILQKTIEIYLQYTNAYYNRCQYYLTNQEERNKQLNIMRELFKQIPIPPMFIHQRTCMDDLGRKEDSMQITQKLLKQTHILLMFIILEVNILIKQFLVVGFYYLGKKNVQLKTVIVLLKQNHIQIMLIMLEVITFWQMIFRTYFG